MAYINPTILNTYKTLMLKAFMAVFSGLVSKELLGFLGRVITMESQNH